MEVALHQRKFFYCPCGDRMQHNVGYLLESARKANPMGMSTAGPWYCDKCTVGWHILARGDGTITLEDKGHRKVNTMVTLRIPPQKKDIILLVKGMAFSQDGSPPVLGGADQYFYEESTCPSNFFRATEVVNLGDDDDPHGLAEYVETVAFYDPHSSDAKEPG